MRSFEDILAEVQRQHPEESAEQQAERAQFRFAHLNKPQAVITEDVAEMPASEPTSVQIHIPDYSRYLKAIVGLLLLLCLLSAKSAFGQLDGLQVQDNSGSVVKQWMGGIAKIKCSANAQCSVSGGVLTINPIDGGAGTTIPTCANQVLTGNGSVLSCVSVSYTNLTNVPTSFTPAAHTQAISTVTGLQTALDGKQAAGSYAAANASTTVNGQTCALGGSCTIETGSSYPGCTSDGANGLECTGTIKAQSVQATGSGYINIAHKADSTTTGDFWRSNDNIKWRGALTTYTAATTADLSNYVSTSALDATLIVGKFSGTGDYLKSDGTKGTPAGTSLPSQTGNSGKYLTTDGTNASWGTVSGAGDTWVVAAATPSFSPAAGTYTGTQSVTASCASGTVYCSTGTSLVSCSGISVSASGSLYARCEESGKKPTNATAAYTINAAAAVADPTFNPAAGTYSSTQSVTISTSTSGATICYTSDGSTPAASTPGTCSAGTTYSTAVSVAATSTLKALGTKSGSTNSNVVSAAYTISAGGGGYSDSFAGTTNTALATHDANWTQVSSTYPVANFKLSGSGSVFAGGYTQASAFYNASTSDTSQVVMKGVSSTTGIQKNVCVRMNTNTRGYCVRFATVSGANWTQVIIAKDDVGVSGGTLTGSWPTASDHTVKIVASGTSTVTITVWVDGSSVGSATDSTSTLTPGHPGFWANVSGSAAESSHHYASWQDN